LLQSVTFIVGIKALLLIVASFYILSLLTASGRVEQKRRAVSESAKRPQVDTIQQHNTIKTLPFQIRPGDIFISILGLFLETLFIRWIGTEIRIFAYLQNTILVVCFLGLGIGMFTSSRPIEIKQSLIPMTVLLILMAIPITRLVLNSTSEMLSTLGDLVIWSGGDELSEVYRQIILLLMGLALTYGVLMLIVDTFVPLGRILGRLMNINPNPIWAYSVNIFGSILGTWAFVLLSFFYQPLFVCLHHCNIPNLVSFKRDRRSTSRLEDRHSLGLQVSACALKVIWSPYQNWSGQVGKLAWGLLYYGQ
jgi:hypothetical protein